jgi:CRISPR/Cas system-associated exonuclease Cas4 (RecB family)
MSIYKWSFSSLQDFEKCKLAYSHRRIHKTPEPENKYLVRGNAIHSVLESYLNNEIEELPDYLPKFSVEMANLRKHGAVAEEELCLDREWSHIPDGWEHPNTWLRAKTDARIDNYVVDFKTGKWYDYHKDQAHLYALALMSIHDFDEVDVEFWYMDSGTVASYQFDRLHFDAARDSWTDRAEKMMNETEFEPTQHKYCNYCYVRKLCPLFK